MSRNDDKVARQRWIPKIFEDLIGAVVKLVIVLVGTGLLMVTTGMPFLSSLFVAVVLLYGIAWILNW